MIEFYSLIIFDRFTTGLTDSLTGRPTDRHTDRHKEKIRERGLEVAQLVSVC